MNTHLLNLITDLAREIYDQKLYVNSIESDIDSLKKQIFVENESIAEGSRQAFEMMIELEQRKADENTRLSRERTALIQLRQAAGQSIPDTFKPELDIEI